ncbi:MAG TPA: tripartite tricarboxylate transporter substrate-binding protein, partial [Xanthobacteraceae bacterium]|nr:tripartite tricarboxylate transporter substrate-binding protein [Xanthobacteraceae bacterium]
MAAITATVRCVVVSASLVWSGACWAAYPDHPVKIIAPFTAGGPSDLVARLLADKLSQSLGQQFYVEDHPGAGGNIGMVQVARSAPDGYTILVASSSFVVNPSLYANKPYDPYKDFAPISLAGAAPNILVVHPAVAAKTVKELIALLQANPAKYAIANSGLGTTPQLAAELFKLDFKLDQPSVPYAGGAPAIQATVAGQTQVGFANLTPAAPQILGGNLRGLAVTALKRSEAVPDVPTMLEAGVAGQESETMQGVLVPAATPQAVIDLLNREIVKALALPDVQEKCKVVGLDIVASTPA